MVLGYCKAGFGSLPLPNEVQTELEAGWRSECSDKISGMKLLSRVRLSRQDPRRN